MRSEILRKRKKKRVKKASGFVEAVLDPKKCAEFKYILLGYELDVVVSKLPRVINSELSFWRVHARRPYDDMIDDSFLLEMGFSIVALTRADAIRAAKFQLGKLRLAR